MLEGVLTIAGATMALFGLFVVADLAGSSARLGPRWQRAVNAGAFLLLALASLGLHTEVRPGVIVDARGAVVASAALFGGVSLGGAVALAAAAYRAALGGAGAAAGVAGVVLDLALSAGALALLRRRGITWQKSLVPVLAAGAAAAAGEAASLLLVPPPEAALALFRGAGPALALVQLLTTLLVGALGRLLYERRREAQERAALSERYALLSRYASDAILLADAEGRVLEANDRAAKLYGRSVEELRSARLEELRSAEGGRPQSSAEIPVTLGRGFRETHRRKDGTTFDAEVHARFLGDASSVLQLLVVHEISAAEKTLLRYHRALETTSEGFALFSGSGRLLEANAAFGALTGYSRPELLEMTPGDFAADPADAPFLSSAAEGAAPLRGFVERRFRRKDGAVVEVEVNASASAPGSGEPTFVFARDIGERKRFERALAESEARYRLLAEHSTDVIWLMDLASGRFTYVSPSVERLRGYTPEEVLAQPVEEALTPESARRVEELFRTRVPAYVAGDESARTSAVERSQPRKDGSVVETEVVASLLKDASGAVAQVLGITRDVTERKRHDAELRREKELLERASRAGKVAMWDVDLATRELRASGYADPLLALQPGRTMTVESFLAEIHPEDRERVFSIFQEYLSSAAAFDVEFRLRRLDGTYAWVRDVGAVVRDAKGLPARLAGAITDVTELKAAEEALRANQSRLEEAQEIAGLGSWSQDLATERIEWSREVWGLLESDPGAALPDFPAYLSAVHPEDRERLAAAHLASVSDGEPRELDHRLRMPDGRVKWVRARWRIERSADGGPGRAVGTLQDVTDHVLAGEARKLAEARDAAEAANRAKSAFLASMSHEIRTPLNAILGFSQLLLGDPGLSARHRAQVDAIVRSGAHLLALIDDVLEMSKIEAGRVTVAAAETDLHALLWDLESMFRLRAQEKGLSLMVERDATVPRHVVTDEKKLRQILINLLGNAVKFTGQGSVALRVSAAASGDGAPLLRADVEDTGPGIAAEDLPRLFQRFEQAEAGRRSTGGTGLGLAISRGFARLLGGDITVRSRSGEGSVFTLTLPVAPSAAPPACAAPGGPAAPHHAVRLAPGEPRRRILVVDDLPENREILLQMLGRVGFHVRTAADGSEAVKLAASWDPDLVLMDLRMPGMDGLSATRALRAAETGRHLPIVAVTASAFEEDRREVEAAGGDAFVSKPIREDELFRAVGRCLGIRWVHGGEAATATAAASGPIPEPVRSGLRAALVRADLDRVLVLADALADESPALARTVRELAERFDYDALHRILDEAETPSGD